MEWFPVCRDGGLDRYFHENVSALVSQGIGGHALVSYAEASTVGDVRVWGMAGQNAAVRERWRGARSAAQEAFRTGVDIANSHFALYAFPWLNCIPVDVPLVVNFHGPWAREMRVEAKTLKKRLAATAAYWIERRVYHRADVLITLSEAFRDLLHQEYRVPLSKIRVVPGGVDLGRYLNAPARQEARQRLGWPADRPIVLAVRRLAKRMGLEALIDAIDQVRREHPNVLLLIGGKGPERDALQTRIRSLGLEENVRLLGFVPEDDLPLAYAAADLSIVPTVTLEGFGLITVESLASGTPVLGTPVGGTPEILRPLDPGLLFDAATAEAMADRICAVLRGSLLLPTREQCRAYVGRYGWDEVIPQLLGIYREAIEQCRAKK